MIKKLIQLSFTLFFFSFQNKLISQCTPDPGLYYPDGWGVVPDDGTVLPVQYVGQPYDYTLFFKAPTTAQQVVDAGYFSSCWPACGQDVDQIEIVNITGMPPGLSENCNSPGCIWYTSEDGCAQVTGIPTTAGYYTIEIKLEGKVTILGIAEYRDYTMTFYQPIEQAPCEVFASIQAVNESTPNAYDGSAVATGSNGDAPYTFEWSNGSDQSQIIGLTAGSYQVTITDNEGCEAFESVTIDTDNTNIDPCLNYEVYVTLSNESYTNSMDGSMEAVINNGEPPYDFSWSNNTSTNPNDNLSEGPYSVTVIDANGCSDAAGAIINIDSIVVNPIDTSINDTNITDTIVLINPCENFELYFTNITNESEQEAMDGSISVALENGTLPYSYTWSNGFNNAVNSNLNAGTYWIYVQDSNGCSLADTINIAIDDSASFFCSMYVNFIKSDESSNDANDGSASVSALGGDGPYDYSWSNGIGNQYISNLNPGIYTVTATDNEGCTTSDSIRVFAFGDETCNLNVSVISNPETYPGAADGSASALTNGGSPPYQYAWSNGENEGTIYNLSTSNYTVTITDQNMCWITVLSTVSVGPISVNEFTENKSELFTFYPNPTDEIINISISSEVNLQNITLRIMDLSGRLINETYLKDKISNHEIILDKNLYPSGTYFLQLITNQEQLTKKLMVK